VRGLIYGVGHVSIGFAIVTYGSQFLLEFTALTGGKYVSLTNPLCPDGRVFVLYRECTKAVASGDAVLLAPRASWILPRISLIYPGGYVRSDRGRQKRPRYLHGLGALTWRAVIRKPMALPIEPGLEQRSA